MKKEHYWIVLAIAVAFAIGAFFYFNSRKKKPAEEKKEVVATDAVGELAAMQLQGGGGGGAAFSAGDVGALVSDAIASIVPQTFAPVVAAPVTSYREILTRRISQPVRNARTFARPLPGTNSVTTPSGGSATIGRNPNAPRFN